MIIRLLFFILLTIVAGSTHAQHYSRWYRNCNPVNKVSIMGSIGLPNFNRVVTGNGFTHRYLPLSNNSAGITASFVMSNKAGIGLGVAASRFIFEHQAEGNFPSLNQFGIVNTRYDLRYVSIPVFLYYQPFCPTSIRITYSPNILSKSVIDPLLFGGAVSQEGSLVSPGDLKKVQHSLGISIGTSFRLGDDYFISVEPFVNYSFDHLEDNRSRAAFRPLTLGLVLSAELGIEDINIDIHPFEKIRERRAERKRKKMEELRQRKEEAERKAREQIEKMKNQK